jgi:hypothetical protein
MNDILGSFIDKKKAESAFLSLEDGESVVVKKLISIKTITKSGFGGEEKEVLRFKCEVETSEGTREKDFDNGTQRFAKELQEKGVQVGCGFTLTRTGQQTKTRYTVSAVTGGVAPVAAPASAPATPATPSAE